MQLAQSRYADTTVVLVSGRVDHASAEQFKAELWPFVAACASGADKLVLDLSGLEYISSAGLRVLMLAAREVRTRDGTLVVSGLQPVVREIFEISRFNVVFQVFADRQAALAAVSGPAATKG